MFTTTGIFSDKTSVLEVIPFYFNEDNSDIFVTSELDGEIAITVCFGTGKGWDVLNKTLEEASNHSMAMGAYTLGYDCWEDYI